MHVKLRYVQRRVDRSGGERWYWHRYGHTLARLLDNPIERMVVAEGLNAAADQRSPGELERGPRSLADPKDFGLIDRVLVPVLAAVLRLAHSPGAATHAIADRPLPDGAPSIRCVGGSITLNRIIADCVQALYRYPANPSEVDPHAFGNRVAREVMDRLQSAGIEVVSR